MANETPILPIPTNAHFKAFYKNVSEGVFLYQPAQGLIIDGNSAFKARIGAADSAAANLSIPLAQLFPRLTPTFEAGDVIHTILALEGSPYILVQLKIAEATLADEPLLLCVLKEQQSQQVLDAAYAEKKALLKEVYHRVKNNLNIIISLLGLQLNRAEDIHVRHVLRESKSRMYALSLLQERLYHSTRISEVKANEYLASLAQSVVATFKESKQQLSFRTQTRECWLNVDVLVPLGLLVHEVVANAVLHAFPQGQSGEIFLLFQEHEVGAYELMIQDTGIGLPAGSSFASFSSLGSQLIINLSRQLKGRLQLESEPAKGTKVIVTFSTVGKYGGI